MPDNSQQNDQSSVNQAGQQPQFQTDQSGKRQQGTGFTNINKILQAGQGAGQQLGQSIQAGIGQQAGQFQQGLGQAQQQFQAGKEQSSFGDTDASKVKAGIQSAVSGQQDPNVANAQQFQKYLSGQYTGPTQLANTQQLQSQAGNIQNLGRATQTEAGRQGLLQQFAGKGQYTGQQQALDQLLLGRTGGQQYLQQAQQNVAGLGQQLSAADQAAKAQAQQAAQGNQAFGQNALSQLGGAVGDVRSQIQKQQDALQAQNAQNYGQANDLYSLINKAATGGPQKIDPTTGNILPAETLTPAELFSKYGSVFTPDVLNKLQLSGTTLAGNIDLNKLANEITAVNPSYGGSVRPEDVITQQQAAQLQALQALAGPKASQVIPSDISQNALTAAQQTGYSPTTAQNFYNATPGIAINQTATQAQQTAQAQQANAQQLIDASNQRLQAMGLSQTDINNAVATGNLPEGFTPPGGGTSDLNTAYGLIRQISQQTPIVQSAQQSLADPRFKTIQQLIDSANAQQQTTGPKAVMR